MTRTSYAVSCETPLLALVRGFRSYHTMKTITQRGLAGLALMCLLSRASALTLTATFDSLDPNLNLPSGYTENGIQFTSPGGFQPVTGSWAATLFGWGGYSYTGNALSVHNLGWVGISVPGNLMTEVSFSGGFDWNGYMIEYNLMDTFLGWEVWRGDILVSAGNREDPGLAHTTSFSYSNSAGFDRVLVRSTAIAYQGIYHPEGWGPEKWYYERGAVIGYGTSNHLAFDNVQVTLVPDASHSALLLLPIILGTIALRSWLRHPSFSPYRGR